MERLELGNSMQTEPLIIVVSDDVDFFFLLNHILKAEGYFTTLANPVGILDIETADRDANAIVIDCRSGALSAGDLCAELRSIGRYQSTPIIALMGPGSEREQVRLINLGINETFTQPIFPSRLIEALHRVTTNTRNRTEDAVYRFADVEMDVDNYRVRRGNRDIRLGPIEFRMLHHFIQNPEQVFSRKQLVEAAWDKDADEGSRIVDVHMGKLRKALSPDGEASLFRTVRGVGYALSREKQSND